MRERVSHARARRDECAPRGAPAPTDIYVDRKVYFISSGSTMRAIDSSLWFMGKTV